MTDLRSAVLELCDSLEMPWMADATKEVAAELLQLCVKYGWKPIESAPDNGDDVLLATGRNVVIGWRSVEHGVWLTGSTDEIVFPAPHLWMPLPKVPKC